MMSQTEKDFYLTLIDELSKENEKLEKNFEDWQQYHNEATNYLTKVILSLDKEIEALRKELEKYESK